MKKKPLTIGFAGIADFRSIIGQDIVSGINHAVKDFNVNLVNFIGVIRYSLAEDIQYYTHYKKKLKFLKAGNIDGVISWSSSFQYFMPETEIIRFHQALSPLPVVSIGMQLPDIPSVLIDNYSGIKALLTHLIQVHGCTKIAFIGSKGKAYYEERFNAYRKVLKENNICYDPGLVYFLNEIENQQEIRNCLHYFFTERKLLPKKNIDAIITVSDLISRLLVENLEEYGIQVPADLAVTGFNNQLGSIRSYPPLTTIDPHFFQFGYKAVVMLLSMLNKQQTGSNLLIPCQLIVRQSCGCFEEFITRAESKQCNTIEHKPLNKPLNKPIPLISNEQYATIIRNFTVLICQIDKQFQEVQARELLDCFHNDIITGSTSGFLNTVRKFFFEYKNKSEEQLITWQNVISEIRNLLLPFYKDNHNILQRVENIFHQTRVMIDVACSYLSFSRKGDVYKTGNLVRIAADFANADNLQMIKQLITLHINELEIPGIYLALHAEPLGSPGKCSLIFSYNKKGEFQPDCESVIIPAYQLISRALLPEHRRYSLLFEILYYKETYLGFVLFEMGPLNIPLYDSLRTILSPVLFRVITDNKKVELKKQLLLYDLQIENNHSQAAHNKKSVHTQSCLNAHTILEYLINHLSEPTNLVKIAYELHLSVPSLMRKTRHLTGYSIQKLHEILKIEKAKILLENKILNISEIAHRLGYQNQFYFSSVFKKHTGMSPKKWLAFKNIE